MKVVGSGVEAPAGPVDPLRAAFDQMPGPQAIWDRNGRRVHVSNAFQLDYAGHPGGLPDRFADHVAILARLRRDSDSDRAQWIETRLANFGQGWREPRVATIDGRYLDLIERPLGDGFVLTAEVDRTEQHVTLNRLSRSEHRLKMAEDVGRLSYGYIDVETGAIEAESLLFELHDIDATQAPRDVDQYLWLVHPDDRHALRSVMGLGRRTDSELWTEYRVIGRSRRPRWLRTCWRPERDSDGQIHRIFCVFQDIDAERRARDQMKANLDQLLLGERMVEMGFWDFDLVTRTAHVSPGFWRIIDVADGEAPPIFETLLARVRDATERDMLRDISQQSLRDGGQKVIELTIARKDGSSRRVRLWGDVVRDGDRAVRSHGAIMDITADYEREQALAQSQQRLLDFIEASSDYFWEQDAQFRATWLANATHIGRVPDFTRNYGKTRWDAAQANADDLNWRAHREDLEARRPFRDFRYSFIADNGRISWRSVSGKPIFSADGEFEGYRGVASDITDRVEAEATLRATEERFRRAFDDAMIGMALVDLNGNFTLVNKALAQMSGYSLEELSDRRVIDLAEPAEQVAILARLKMMITEDRDRDYDVERAMIHRQGHTLLVRAQKALVRDEIGRPLYYVAQYLDITEERRALSQLAAAKTEAEAASKAKSQFLGNMSHELRTPLNAIIGFGDIIAHALLGELSERYQQYGRDIVHSGRHLLDLINDVLDTARHDLSSDAVSKEPLPLSRVVDDAARIVRQRAEEAGLKLTVSPIDPSWIVYAEARGLRQVLINLIGNAIKFTARGGAIAIQCTKTPGWTAITVADTGIGISIPDLQRIFLPFVQVEREKGRYHEGTGLGLPLSRQIVERHGGRIEAVSEVGKGSRFTVLLPDGGG